MGDRMEELKGSMKEGAGKITGDTELQAEGSAQHDAASSSREMKGIGNEVKGNLKEGLGALSGDEETRTEGEADRLKGTAQRIG
jgi:uncharacterized protein YjbJ (UPF0337 family)